MQTYEIFHYPLTSTRANADFYDDVECDEQTVTDLCRLLNVAMNSKGLWFYFKLKPATEPVVPNWDFTGRFMVDDAPKDPVGDPLFDGLKQIVG